MHAIALSKAAPTCHPKLPLQERVYRRVGVSYIILSMRIGGRGAAAARCVRAGSSRLALVATIILGGLLLPASAVAGPVDDRAPVIESIGYSEDGEIAITASIDPNGLQTSYEIWLTCGTCGPPGYTPAVGELPAVQEAVSVSLALPGINPGVYGFAAIARNEAGYTLWAGELTVPEPPAGGEPTGLGSGEKYVAEITPAEVAASNAVGEQISREAQEARARLQSEEERKATEARVAAEAAEIQRAKEQQEREAVARKSREEAAVPPACVVPSLEDDMIVVARRALSKAHCRIGRVHRLGRRGRHGQKPRVLRQGVKAGTRLEHRARVSLWLGERGRRVKRRPSSRS